MFYICFQSDFAHVQILLKSIYFKYRSDDLNSKEEAMAKEYNNVWEIWIAQKRIIFYKMLENEYKAVK